MAVDVGKAYVQLVPSAKGFAAKMQSELGGDLAAQGRKGGEQYGDQFTDSSGKKVGGGAKRVFAGLAKAGPLAAAAAGLVVGKVLVDSISEAADFQQSVGAIDTVFGKSAKQMHKWSASAATNVGLTKNEFNELGTLIGSQLKNGGTAMEDLAPKTNQLIGLGADLSSMFGGTTKEAVDALSSALKGERDPIERFGVSLSQAKIDAEAAALGFEKVDGALSAEGSQAATLSLIMKQTADAHGNFAKETDTLAHQQQVLEAQWGNIKTTIGTALLPVLTDLFTAINDAVPKVQAFFGALKGGGDSGKKVSAALGPVGDVVTALVSVLKGVDWESMIKPLGDAFRDAVIIAQRLWELFGPTIVKYVRGAVTAVIAVLGGLINIIGGILKVISGILTGDWGKAWDGVKQIVRGAVQIVVGLVKNMKNLVMLPIRLLWTGLKALFRAGVNAIVGYIKWWISTNVAIVRGGMRTVSSVVSSGISTVVNFLKGLPGRAKNALGRLGSTLRSVVSRAFDSARSAVSSGVSAIVSGIASAPGRIGALAGRFASAGKHIIQSLMNGLKSAGSVVSDIAGNIWSTLRASLNSALSALDSALSFTINIGPFSKRIDAPIPRLATGGRATAATLAVIGEGREPETVLPDSVLRGLLERTAAAARSGAIPANTRFAMTITDWENGIGFIESLADGRIDAADLMYGQAVRAGAV